MPKLKLRRKKLPPLMNRRILKSQNQKSKKRPSPPKKSQRKKIQTRRTRSMKMLPWSQLLPPKPPK
jgi:hypothetical protein